MPSVRSVRSPRRGPGDQAVRRLCLCERDFHCNDAGEPVLLVPDCAHLRGAVPELDRVDCHENRWVVREY